MKNRPQSNLSGAVVRRLYTLLQESQLAVPGAINQARPVSDPQNQTPLSTLSLNQTARLLYGVVTDGTPIGNIYRVNLEGVKQPVIAVPAQHSTCSITGARELNTLSPGVAVICSWHEQLQYAVILAVIPSRGTDARYNQHSLLLGTTRARVDEAHKQPFRFPDSRIPSFTSGRPFDATHNGEAGWITETGMKLLIDSFMAILGLDEGCQLSFFYHDMLCRLAAYQFQLWTGVRETESFNDQDEAQDWTGYAMYPWENLGLAARGDPSRILSAADWQQQSPYYGKMEPVDDYLMPFHREREYHGYLGQGFKHCLVAPPIQFSQSGDAGGNGSLDRQPGNRTQHLSYDGGSGIVGANCPGLYDHFITADGRVCYQSAKGFSFVKRACIMLPTRRARPDDPQGDTPDNYKFSAVLGNGPEHKITGDLEIPDEEAHSGLTRALGVMDLHSYIFNYAGLHPFFYHDKDYKVYEESEAVWADGQSAAVPQFGLLAESAYIDPEAYSHYIQIDHRYNMQKFYKLAAGIDITEDGGVILSCGYGSSIRMVGGSIELSAPGDIWLRSGRNVNAWAGQDAIIRARQSWDITATNGDGRLKAENNMMALAGNSGQGGILLESRGLGFQHGAFNFDEPGEQALYNGIVLRSRSSPIVSWSNGVYFRTGGEGVGGGPIVFDADKGQQPFIVRAQSICNYIQTQEAWYFGLNEDTVQNPSSYITQDDTVLSGKLRITDDFTTQGQAIVGGSIACCGGIAAATGAPFIAELKGQSLESIRSIADYAETFAKQTIPQTGQDQYLAYLAPFYNENGAGNDDVILKGEFSLRSQEDYHTEAFKLYEDRWQQLSRQTQQDLPTWEEKPVIWQGRETYPYPGQEAFQATDRYVQQDFSLFDAASGRSKDRGQQPTLSEDYESPRFGQQRTTSLNDYIVIR